MQRKLDRVGQYSKGAKYKKLLIGITNQIWRILIRMVIDLFLMLV